LLILNSVPAGVPWQDYGSNALLRAALDARIQKKAPIRNFAASVIIAMLRLSLAVFTIVAASPVTSATKHKRQHNHRSHTKDALAWFGVETIEDLLALNVTKGSAQKKVRKEGPSCPQKKDKLFY
jgi:hypothetical protein